MAIEEKGPSKSLASAQKLLHAALKVLRDAGGEMSGREVISRVEKAVELSPWERERLEKSGYIRWQSILHFYTVDATKAGFMRKKKGVWVLTPEGTKAIDLGPKELMNQSQLAYRRWRRENPKTLP